MADPVVAVVGGSLGGLRAAEQLRLAGHAGAITVYGAEPHLPYNRPPLSKELLADPEPRDLAALHARTAFRRRAVVDDVDFRLGARVVHADLRAGTLRLADGSQTAYDGLVVATGLRARRLDVPGPRAGRFALRTLEDCADLRVALGRRGSVVVVGAGFVGCEVACTLRSLGHRVTVVEPAGAPMARVLGDALASAVQRHHERSGLRFVIGRGVTGFAGTKEVTGVRLDDGRHLEAQVVVEAVGSVCNTEWLAANPGIDLEDGVRTDELLSVVGAPDAVAVGDLARFPNPLFDDVPRRVEHWSMPTDTAKRAAATLAARLRGAEPDPTPFRPVPSFWSDQGDLRFQSFGSPGLADEVHITEGDLTDLGSGVLATYLRAGALVGYVALNLTPARQRGLRDDFVSPAPTT